MKQPLSIYIHIPFCPSKCGYCDFNSYAMTGDIHQKVTDAIIKEIQFSPLAGRPAKTIFFGGGTPTYIPSEQLITILNTIREVHPPLKNCEITSEANPGTVDAKKFESMFQAGFNRLSMGAQSFQTEDLLRLGRIHSPTEIIQAFSLARKVGFKNINLDLMFALPGQSERAWQENLKIVHELKPNHLSLYCLTIEPNTKFFKHHRRGTLNLPDDETQRKMYDFALKECHKNNLIQYEISNYCESGKECQHNLAYWNSEEYAGYGPGAVASYETSNGRIRRTNIKHPDSYVQAVHENKKLNYEEEILTQENLNFEKIMLGLRLNSGLEISNLNLDQHGLQTALEREWLAQTNSKITLTESGRHFCSEVTLLITPEMEPETTKTR